MSTDDTALAAIERRVNTQITDQISTAGDKINTSIATAIKNNPDATTGNELVSRPDVNRATTDALTNAQNSTTTSVTAGYNAATTLALIAMVVLLLRSDNDQQTRMPDLGSTLTNITADIARAYGAALLGIQNNVRAGHDTVSGPKATPARILISRAAVDRELRRLTQRMTAAGSVAVHQGYSDAQEAIAAAFAQDHPGMYITKTWRTTSAKPCPSCAALDGTELTVGEQFDRQAGVSDKFTPPGVYGDLKGPPRHPNCRCRVDYAVRSTR